MVGLNPQRRLLRLVLGVTAHPVVTLLICAAVLAVCIFLAFTRLPVSTDQNKLFSAKAQFFHDWLEFNQKFPENEALYVIVEPNDPQHVDVGQWTGLVDRITRRLRNMPEHVRDVDSRVPVDRLGRAGLLFEEPRRLPDRLKQLGQFSRLAGLWSNDPASRLLGASPLQRFINGMSLAPTDSQTGQFLNLLANSWNRSLETGKADVPDLSALSSDPRDLGYYQVANELDHSKQRLLIQVYLRDTTDALNKLTKTVDAIRTATMDEAKNTPGYFVEITGRPALDADEMRTTDHDSTLSEIVALSTVFVVMVFVLRSVWLALAAEICLGVGIGWTFGWATLTVGQLNLLSLVFLIALIGIGMDYLVQILTRYRLEARRYQRPDAAWIGVFRHVGPPINTACMGAAMAFFVSVFTDFRGAADLGIIAAGGLLLTLISGYTVLPAMLVIWPPRLRPRHPQWRYSHQLPMKFKGRIRLLPAFLWLAALAAAITQIDKARFDAGLLDLQAPDLASVKLVRTLQTWSAVVLSKDADKIAQARAAVQDSPLVDRTESIADADVNRQTIREFAANLPVMDWSHEPAITADQLPALAVSARNLAKHAPAAAEALSRLAQDIESAIGNRQSAINPTTANILSSWQHTFILQLQDILGQLDPPPLDVESLPAELRRHLQSADGTWALYIYPKGNLWDQRNQALDDFVTDVQTRINKLPHPPTLTGIALDIDKTTGAIRHSFYWATGYALAFIVLLVSLDLRNLRHTLLAVGVLALGLPMLVGLMGFFGIPWNFANFFGLPILIGAGHEYGVFMVHRYLEARHYHRRVWRGWDVSDRALLLCAFITSSSFGFFWIFAHHLGLRSLGMVMAVGTACIYLATVLALRPYLLWKLERRAIRLQTRLPAR